MKLSDPEPRRKDQVTGFEHGSASLTLLTWDMYLNLFFFICKMVLLLKVTVKIK